jgi:predicted nucleic acid-binding protein
MPCLDTTVLIDLARPGNRPQRLRAENAVRRILQAGDPVATTRVNEAEFRVGIYRSPNPATERESVERVLAQLMILDLDAHSAEMFARAKAHVLNIGRPTGDADLLIGAIASGHRLPLLTRNPSDFENIPGLVVVTY